MAVHQHRPTALHGRADEGDSDREGGGHASQIGGRVEQSQLEISRRVGNTLVRIGLVSAVEHVGHTGGAQAREGRCRALIAHVQVGSHE